GSQRKLIATAFSAIQMTTATVCPAMYCGVPKKRAAASALRPKASSPKALVSWGTCASSRRSPALLPSLTRAQLLGSAVRSSTRGLRSPTMSRASGSVTATRALAAVVGDDGILLEPPARYLADETEARGLRGRADAVV